MISEGEEKAVLEVVGSYQVFIEDGYAPAFAKFFKEILRVDAFALQADEGGPRFCGCMIGTFEPVGVTGQAAGLSAGRRSYQAIELSIEMK